MLFFSGRFIFVYFFKICSLHFLKSDFKIASEKWRLKPNAVPTIFAWTNKKPKKNVIKVPSFTPKPSGEEIENEELTPEEVVIKIENTESIAENKIFGETCTVPNIKPKITNDDNFKNDDYKQMYIALLKENCYLKNELETLNYKYKDQEDLYENLVVVNKTTQKENSELRHTVAILQACLKKTSIFHEPSTIYLTQHNISNNDKLIIQQQQQFQQQYQQLLQHQHQLQLMQNRQLQQNYQIVQTKEKNFIELQKAIVNQYVKVGDAPTTTTKKKDEYEGQNMLQKLLEKSRRDDTNKKRKTSTDFEMNKGFNENTKRKSENQNKEENKIVQEDVIKEVEEKDKIAEESKKDIKEQEDEKDKENKDEVKLEENEDLKTVENKNDNKDSDVKE